MANKRLIDANALLKELRQELRDCQKDADEFGGENILWAEGIEFAIDTVKQTNTVDAVEVVHAAWGDGGAVDSHGNIVYKSIDCSNCFEYFKIETHDRKYWKNRFKVCPFCGAVMDGGNEDA